MPGPLDPDPDRLTGRLPGRVRSLRHRLRRSVLRHRRLLAAAFALIGVAAGLQAVSSTPPTTVEVLVAARDLPAGTRLSARDLTTVEFAPDSVPAAVVEAPSGEVIAAPLSAGEPITESRLVGPALAGGSDELTTLPIRLPDSGMVDLLGPGDVIDLWAADPQGSGAERVALGVRVLAVPPAQDSATGQAGLPGRLVVIACEPSEVSRLTASGVADYLTYAWSIDRDLA